MVYLPTAKCTGGADEQEDISTYRKDRTVKVLSGSVDLFLIKRNSSLKISRRETRNESTCERSSFSFARATNAICSTNSRWTALMSTAVDWRANEIEPRTFNSIKVAVITDICSNVNRYRATTGQFHFALST